MSIEAMKQAVSLLVSYQDFTGDFRIANECGVTIAALRQAIEQAEKQEPVAWMTNSEQDVTAEFLFSHVQTPMHKIPLYEAPPKRPVKSYTGGVPQYATDAPKREWVGLTDEEITEYSSWLSGRNVVRAIEQRLKEKNT